MRDCHGTWLISNHPVFGRQVQWRSKVHLVPGLGCLAGQRGCHEDRCSLIPVESSQQWDEQVCGRSIQITCRLINNQELRFHSECTCEIDSAPLSSAKSV